MTQHHPSAHAPVDETQEYTCLVCSTNFYFLESEGLMCPNCGTRDEKFLSPISPEEEYENPTGPQPVIHAEGP